MCVSVCVCVCWGDGEAVGKRGGEGSDRFRNVLVIVLVIVSGKCPENVRNVRKVSGMSGKCPESVRKVSGMSGKWASLGFRV